MSFRKPHLLIAILITVLLPVNLPGQGLKEKIDSVVTAYYDRQEFNGTVLVAQRGQPIYKKGFGFADLEKQIPNTPNTKFSIGSATKSFTAIAILQLVERGLVNLNTPIKEYIPDLKGEIGGLTLHLLMKNSTGLPVHLNRLTTLEYRDISIDELIGLYNTASLSMEPGSRFEYSNLNYQLCGMIIEKVSGTSYKEYIDNNIFTPLKMNSSGVERTNLFPRDKAKGYNIESEKLKPAPKNYMAYALGGGDIYASAIDLLKWDQALYDTSLLSVSSKELLFDGKPGEFGGYGYGFKVKPYQRHDTKKPVGKLVRHGGSMYGYVCNIHRYLDDKTLIIVLGNIRPFPVMALTTEIEALIFSQPN